MDERESKQLPDITWENKSEAGSRSPPAGYSVDTVTSSSVGGQGSAGSRGHFTSGCRGRWD